MSREPATYATTTPTNTVMESPGRGNLEDLAGLAPREEPASPRRSRPESQSVERRDRCLALALARNLVGTARCAGLAPTGDTVYQVPSMSTRGGLHRVRCQAHGELVCDCTAGQYGNPCWHVGAVIALHHLVNACAPPIPGRPSGAGRDPEYAAWFAWLCGGQVRETAR